MAKLCGLVAFLFILIGRASSSASDNPPYYDLAKRWAPVFYQDIAVKGNNIKQDFVTNYDFDGDDFARNNWENQPNYPNKGYVYYDVVETGTHYFIFYSMFHARDWEQLCFWEACHENDLENVRLVVKKKQDDVYGEIVLMETQAHGFIYSYINPPYQETVGEKGHDFDGTVLFDWVGGEQHPKVYIQAHGHGPFSCGHTKNSWPLLNLGDLQSSCSGNFPGGDGVAYKLLGRGAEEPDGTFDLDVSYELLWGYSKFWEKRHAVSVIWKDTFTYYGDRLGRLGCPIGTELDGDNWGNGGTPPWSYKDNKDNFKRGDWTLDSGWTITKMYNTPWNNDPNLTIYPYNPYLEDILAENITDNIQYCQSGGGNGGGGGGSGGGGGGNGEGDKNKGPGEQPGCSVAVAGADASTNLLFYFLFAALFIKTRRRI